MDYYETLGVGRNATAEEIKKAYRKRAKETHPDANKDDPTAEDKFKEVSEAYSILKDSEKKFKYDNPQVQSHMPQGFEDFINSNFGFGGQRRPDPDAPRKGKDVRINKDISLFESLFGTAIKAGIKYSDDCNECSGVGGIGVGRSCTYCSGTGMMKSRRGDMTVAQHCHHCGARGYHPATECVSCSATGVKEYNTDFDVTIPPGFTGGTVRVENKGGPGRNGGPTGDLYINVSVRFPSIPESDISNKEKVILKKYLG